MASTGTSLKTPGIPGAGKSLLNTQVLHPPGMIREESASQLSQSQRSSRGNSASRDFRIKKGSGSAVRSKQKELTTKGLLGMSKPHMLGAQNDNIKKMLGMEVEEPEVAEKVQDKTQF